MIFSKSALQKVFEYILDAIFDNGILVTSRLLMLTIFFLQVLKGDLIHIWCT